MRSKVIPCGRSRPPGTGILVIRPVAEIRARVPVIVTAYTASEGDAATAVTWGSRASVETRFDASTRRTSPAL